jgi:hypothetical protein
MKFRLAISIFCLVFANVMNAQDAIPTLKPQNKFGIKMTAGVLTTGDEKINLPTQTGNSTFEYNKVGIYYGMGLWSQHQIGWLYAESNIIYNRYTMNYLMATNRADEVTESNIKENHNYISGQIIAGLKYEKFRIGVGPGINFAAGYDSNLENQNQFHLNQRNISYSFSGLIGFDIQRFSIDIQFDKAFRSIGDHIYSDVRKSRFKETPDVVRINVAYQLF